MTPTEHELTAAKVAAHLAAQRVYLEAAKCAPAGDVAYYIRHAEAQAEAIGAVYGDGNE